MIKQLTLQNFTVFKNADLHFSSGLNVIVGENGTGKTHLLKLTYLFSQARYRCDLIKNKSSNLEAKVHQDYFSERLQELFKCDSIGSLVSADSDGQSKISASITINIQTPQEPESRSQHRAIIDLANIKQKLKQLLRAVDAHPKITSIENMQSLN
jgi:AAA15 family ATPase/GTPase